MVWIGLTSRPPTEPFVTFFSSAKNNFMLQIQGDCKEVKKTFSYFYTLLPYFFIYLKTDAISDFIQV